MAIMAAIAIGAAVVGAYQSYKGGKDAKAAAGRAGELNYENIMAETAESIRRAEMSQEQAYGSAIAALGGSGVLREGTPDIGLNAMQTEFTRQNVWEQEAGQRRADIARETGQDVGAAAMGQGTASAFAQASNIFTNQWWNMANTTGGA